MNPQILIAEDERDIAETLAFALESEGYTAMRAATAGEALRLFQDESFDLAILDIGLPDESGFELLKKIRRNSEMPVMILSARNSETDRILGFELGGDDYVAKPFSPREVAARVKAILRRSNSESGMVFQLDENRMQIRYHGHLMELSRYEYMILNLLLKRPGWIFSREKIMELIWDDPGASMDRTVDAHIKTIRSKIKNIDPDSEPIRTHRGMGYSLRETL